MVLSERERVERADWDGAWKQLVTRLPGLVLGQVCGLEVSGARIVGLPTETPRPMLPDLVFRVSGSDGAAGDRLIHLEVQVRPEAGFELRLATYFVLLAHRHRLVPHQVVVMPRGGPFTGRYSLGPLSLDYQVVDVGMLDPEVLLAGPLAPLALWSVKHREDPEWQARVVEIVVERIREAGDHDLRALLAQLVILQGEAASALLVEGLERRNMSDVISDSAIGRRLLAQGEAKGLAEGLAEGLLVMLRERFGEVGGLDVVARRLAETGNFEAGLARIRAAATLDDVLAP